MFGYVTVDPKVLTPQQRAHIQAVIDDITGAVPGTD